MRIAVQTSATIYIYIYEIAKSNEVYHKKEAHLLQTQKMCSAYLCLWKYCTSFPSARMHFRCKSNLWAAWIQIYLCIFSAMFIIDLKVPGIVNIPSVSPKSASSINALCKVFGGLAMAANGLLKIYTILCFSFPYFIQLNNKVIPL